MRKAGSYVRDKDSKTESENLNDKAMKDRAEAKKKAEAEMTASKKNKQSEAGK
jgi:hypothetical protein